MKMKIGKEVSRAVILKYRQRLKAALAEHEVKAADDYREDAHMLLLLQLCGIVEEENERYRN
jgi:hypothetical protein